jgi:putative Mg2+ transporter-C (MgtC) family protein
MPVALRGGMHCLPLLASTAEADFEGPLGIAETALRLSIATAAAALIGWERERKNRPAGLRTHMLVGLGACLFTLLAIEARHELIVPGVPGPDPLRVVDGVVGGVGFLGAGAILQSRGNVKGLTTAAGVWVVAAIGVAAALGSYPTVAVALGLAGITLTVVKSVERSWIHRDAARRGVSPDAVRADDDEGARDDVEGVERCRPSDE